jgi:uncharacterized membrane protein
MSLKKIPTLIKKTLFPHSTQNQTIKNQILSDRRRFAQIASYTTLTIAIISTAISLIGVISVLQGQLTTGTLTTISGFLATNSLAKIAKEANQQIDRLFQDD